MKDMGIVQGSAAQAVPVFINGDIVYVHKDIQEITRKDETVLYEYHEYQYSKDEYIQVMTQQNEEMMLAIAELGIMVAGTGDVNG